MRLVPLLWFAATASAAYKGVVPGANHLDECNFVRNSFIIQVAGSDAALAKRGLTPARVSRGPAFSQQRATRRGSLLCFVAPSLTL